VATATRPKLSIGPKDHGRRMSLDQFVKADFQEGYLYELARGVIVVTEVPGPDHGEIVDWLTTMFVLYRAKHPGIITYRAGGGECRLRLPGMQSDRHPDQAIYLTPRPRGKHVWTKWVPALVVEVVSEGGEDRDYQEKREEYLRIGILEYWIINPRDRSMLVLEREGDTWAEQTVTTDKPYRARLLPGLVVRLGELLDGPPKRKR
jgi:Uma2 family endonuclease